VIWVNPSESPGWRGKRFAMPRSRRTGNGTFAGSATRQVLSLTAVDDHTIAWLQDDFICRLDLSKDCPATNNPFVGLSQESSWRP